MKYRAICKNKEFTRAYSRGKSYVDPLLVLYVCKNRLGYTRVGLTATKKIGGAVQRNRARRVMRAALCEHLPCNVGGYDIILVARGQTTRVKSQKVSAALARLLDRAKLPHARAEKLPAALEKAQTAETPPAAARAEG